MSESTGDDARIPCICMRPGREKDTYVEAWVTWDRELFDMLKYVGTSAQGVVLVHLPVDAAQAHVLETLVENVTGGRLVYRYARIGVIGISNKGGTDVHEYFRAHAPELVEQGRVFVTEVECPITAEGTMLTMGMALPLKLVDSCS